MDETHQLRVLIANERLDRLALLADVVTGLGHEVIASEVDVREVGAVTAREHPDVALVGLGLSSEHALTLIAEIVHEASCPVIALLSARDPAYVREAAKRGIFAYIVDTTPEELQSAIDITLQRFTEYHSLQGAFGATGSDRAGQRYPDGRNTRSAPTKRSSGCACTPSAMATSSPRSRRRWSTATFCWRAESRSRRPAEQPRLGRRPAVGGPPA